MIRLSLGEEAQALENAGKSRDIGYIIGHHEEFMKAYEDLKEPISRVFALLDDDGADTSDKPLADATLLSTVYEELDKAADSMDCDALQAIFDDMDGYRIPEVE
ncbi:MAG: hypothetical protein K6G16_06450 [Lachnospiraceae bacterium]|nr:hypothetical protein [Lachnospiraceae bacterium]